MTDNNLTPAPPVNGTIRAERVAKQRKDYWGITAILVSFLVLGGFVILGSIAVALVAIANVVSSGSIDTSNATQITDDLLSNPWVIIGGTVPMYVAWVICAVWLSKYRSGVPSRFKTTWEAFKHNFWLTKTRWYDVFIGLGIAILFVLLQTLVMFVLPILFPDFDTSTTDNTGPFANMEGIAFFLIGFGIVGFLGPIMEELFFRGLLLRGLLNRFDKSRALKTEYNVDAKEGWFYKHRAFIVVLITSIIFGMFHFQSPTAGSIVIVLITGSLGFGLGMMTLKLNRAAPSMYAHAFHNTIAIVALTAEKYFSAN